MPKPAKKQKKSSSKTKKKFTKPEDGTNEESYSPEPDFGGLPDRDIKKALGCGG